MSFRNLERHIGVGTKSGDFAQPSTTTFVFSRRLRGSGNQSKRANKQVDKWNNDKSDPDGPYTSKIVKHEPSGTDARGKIYDWEQQNATKHRSTLDPLKHIKPKP